MSESGPILPTEELSPERKKNREKIIAKAERILTDYENPDSDGEIRLQSIIEMRSGSPAKVIELLEIAISNCKSRAGDLLQETEYSEPGDLEESMKKQQEYLEMEELVRNIKVEYSIPIEFTPALKRQFAGKKDLGKIIEGIENNKNSAANDED